MSTDDERNDVMNIENYKFSVDWLNVRLDVSNPFDFLHSLEDELNSRFLVRSNPINFYKNALYLDICGSNSLLVGYNVDSNGQYVRYWSEETKLPNGLFISISGDGCRFIESNFKGGLREFCLLLNEFNPVVTRIDIACDILDSENKIVPFIQKFAREEVFNDNPNVYLNCGIQRCSYDKDRNKLWKTDFCVIDSNFDTCINQFCDNVTIGSRSSKKGTMQLYNKGLEVRSGRLSDISQKFYDAYGNPDYWWRLEYRCKSYAQTVFNTLLEKGVISAFYDACFRFGNFVVADYDENHISQCSTVDIWSGWIGFLLANCTDSIHLVQFTSLPYVKPTFERYCNWASSQDIVNAKNYLLSQQGFIDIESSVQRGLSRLLNDSKYKPFLENLNLI